MQLSKPIKNPLETHSDQDAELVLAAQRDPVVFQQIYDRWAVTIYKYFYFRTGEPTSAEDLTSQLFLSAYQRCPAISIAVILQPGCSPSLATYPRSTIEKAIGNFHSKWLSNFMPPPTRRRK
jgi:hypothetical protein